MAQICDLVCRNCKASIYEKILLAKCGSQAEFCSQACGSLYNYYEKKINKARVNLLKGIVIQEHTLRFTDTNWRII